MITLVCSTPTPWPIWLASDEKDDNEQRDQSGGIPQRDLGRLRVLIVEDEFFISLNTETMLEEFGHVVVGTAISADQAVRLAEQERPDVVLMDIRLIGARDGIDAAKEIYAKFDLRSIFVTANTDPHTKIRARDANPLGFIEKPLTEERLKSALEALT